MPPVAFLRGHPDGTRLWPLSELVLGPTLEHAERGRLCLPPLMGSMSAIRQFEDPQLCHIDDLLTT